MRSREQQVTVPVVTTTQLLHEAQREQPVLVVEVGPEAQDRLRADRKLGGPFRWAGLPDGVHAAVVYAAVHDAGALRLDQIFRKRFGACVVRQEHDMVGERQREPRESAVVAPRFVVAVVRGVVVPDQILVGDDQAVAEADEHLHVGLVVDLERPMDDVETLQPACGVLGHLDLRDFRDGGQRVGGIVADLVREERRSRNCSVAASALITSSTGTWVPVIGPVSVRASISTETPRSDRLAAPSARARGPVWSRSSPRSSGGSTDSGQRERSCCPWPDSVDRCARSCPRRGGARIRRRRGRARGPPAGTAARSHIFAVAGCEREIELADQLERAAADVHAVPDRGRQPRPDPQRAARTAAAASSSRQPAGSGPGSGPGTETMLPWLVSEVTVATRLSLYAADLRPSSQPSATSQSELTITTSAGAAAANAPLTFAGNPTLAISPDIEELVLLLAPSPSRAVTCSCVRASGLASSQTRIATSGGVCSRTVARHRTNSSRAPYTGIQNGVAPGAAERVARIDEADLHAAIMARARTPLRSGRALLACPP